jgi:dTDP-glucose pyrophosphorylase
MVCIDRNGKGIALVADKERRLLGTVTDGDIRRAILAETDLSSKVTELLKRKAQTPYARPITAPAGTSRPHLFRLMREHSIRHVPLLDEDGRIVDLVMLEELPPSEELAVTAVIMAGGYGRRLRPLTEDIPKPMLPVGGRPIMEWVVEGLKEAGIKRIFVTTHYKAQVIIRHFGDGEAFGVEIEYIHEKKPSGTLAPLRLLDSWKKPVLVINGDIMTRVDFRRMLNYHQKRKAVMTVAVRDYRIKVPYGIVEMEGERIKELVEKPSRHFFVNAGIYLLDVSLQRQVVEGKLTDMTDLISQLIEEGKAVAGFPVMEYLKDLCSFVHRYGRL